MEKSCGVVSFGAGRGVCGADQGVGCAVRVVGGRGFILGQRRRECVLRGVEVVPRLSGAWDGPGGFRAFDDGLCGAAGEAEERDAEARSLFPAVVGAFAVVVEELLELVVGFLAVEVVPCVGSVSVAREVCVFILHSCEACTRSHLSLLPAFWKVWKEPSEWMPVLREENQHHRESHDAVRALTSRKRSGKVAHP